MIYLSEKDIVQVPYLEIINAVECAYELHYKEQFQMPQRIHIDHGDDTLLYMPCFTANGFGTKMITCFPKNSSLQEPVIQGLMIYNHKNTGKPLAIMDGKTITGIRTGAVGAVAVKHLTPEESTVYGIVGTGVQAYYQALAISKVRDVKTLYLMNRTIDKAYKLKLQLETLLPTTEIIVMNDIHAAVAKCDVIITTTNSNQPVLPDDLELLKGKCIIAIGSYKPDMRELPDALFKLINHYYIDTKDGMKESGDLIHPVQNGLKTEKDFIELSSLLFGDHRLTDETVCFKSVGMALFDVVVAEKIHNYAKSNEMGQLLE